MQQEFRSSEISTRPRGLGALGDESDEFAYET